MGTETPGPRPMRAHAGRPVGRSLMWTARRRLAVGRPPGAGERFVANGIASGPASRVAQRSSAQRSGIRRSNLRHHECLV
jgi:hypothetical protein